MGRACKRFATACRERASNFVTPFVGAIDRPEPAYVRAIQPCANAFGHSGPQIGSVRNAGRSDGATGAEYLSRRALSSPNGSLLVDFSEYNHCILRHLMIKIMMIKGWDLSTPTWLGVASHSDPARKTGRRQAGEGIRELWVENSTRC